MLEILGVHGHPGYAYVGND